MVNNLFAYKMVLDLSTIAAIFGIIATLITGAVWVMSLVNKVTARVVTQSEHIKNLEKNVEKLEATVKDHESKNSYFRHNFESVTKGLEIYISGKIESLTEVINIKFKNLEEKINEKK